MTFDMFQEYIEEHILEGWKSDVELVGCELQKYLL